MEPIKLLEREFYVHYSEKQSIVCILYIRVLGSNSKLMVYLVFKENLIYSPNLDS